MVREVERLEAVLLLEEVDDGGACPHEAIAKQLMAGHIVLGRRGHADYKLEGGPQPIEL